MYRLGPWGLAAAVAAALAPPALAADPSPPAGGPPWVGRLFGGSPDPAKKPAAEPRRPEGRPPAPGPLAPEALADALKAEQDAYTRRLDVCTKLRQVAAQTHNDGLTEQADALEKQATALYHGRVARLGVRGGPRGAVGPVPALPATARRPDPAETLDRRLGAGTADPRSALIPPPGDRPATASARDFRRAPE